MVISTVAGQTHVTMRGPETKATRADAPADGEFVGIVFKLGAFMPHLPIKELRDRQDLQLPLGAGRSFWLDGGTWQLPSYDNADTFLDRLIRADMLHYDPVVNEVLRGGTPDFSPRALQYRFLRATGLTQNTIQQIRRAQAAINLLKEGMPIIDAAFELGYVDQPHLTRSLKRFAGETPAKIAAPD